MGSSGSTTGAPVRALVLGCMGAGKSTFIKQMLNKNNKSISRREYYVYGMQLNLLKILQELKTVCKELEIDYRQYEKEFDEIERYKHRETMNTRVTEAVRTLKNSGLVEACKKKQRTLQLPINYNYLLQRSDEIIADGFVPTDTDILMSYAETVGNNVEDVICQSVWFELTEIPGHHLGRARWEKYFPTTHLIIFVIDLAELCDPAFYRGHLENKTVAVFTELINNPLLAQVCYMLLFNKVDTFNENSAGFDFKKLAAHTDTPESARTFYRGKFTTLVPREKCFAHNVSLVAKNDINTAINDLTRNIKNIYRERVAPA